MHKGWKVIKVSEIARGIRGVSYKPWHLKEKYSKDTVILLRSNNIQNASLNLTDIQFVPLDILKRDQLCDSGDIVMCMSNGSRDLVGKNGLVKSEWEYLKITCGAFCSIFKAVEPSEKAFLYYLFQSHFFKKQLDVTLSGSAINNLQNSQVENFHFTIPSTKLNRTRIASVLSTLDNQIENTEAIIAKYQAIKQGVLHDLFTRGIDIPTGKLRLSFQDDPELYAETELGWIPKDWSLIKLGLLIEKIDSGWSPVCEAFPASAGEWGSLKTTSITWEGYDSNENKKLPDDLNPDRNAEAKLNDILITRVGPRERVGVVVYVDDPREKLMISDNMLRLKLKNSNDIHIPFLPLVLGSEHVQGKWRNEIAGLAEAQVVINQQTIKRTLLVIPPIEEQRKISEHAALLRKTIHSEKKKLEKLKKAKQGLMSDLLSGKVEVTINETTTT